MKYDVYRHVPAWLLFFLAALFFTVATYRTAEAESVDSLLMEVKEKTATITSLRSDFVQTKKLALFKNSIVFGGELAVTRPDKLRWEFNSPVVSVLVFNGEEGLRCTENEKTARFNLNSDPIMSVVADQLWTWLGGDLSALKEDYDLSLQDASTLLVIPRNKQTAEMIDAISLRFTPVSRQIERVIIREPGGDETRIEFSNHQFNTALPDSLFTQCLTGE